MSNLLKIISEPQPLEACMPVFKPLPQKGERKLCLLHGEWVVLEVGVESPTYEESFTEFSYWFEPFMDMHSVEYDGVVDWVDLPEIPTKEQSK
tara:strand:+ start:435 stop:713 length:279 start_codon:yes stop_codon:yes gene_type:complete